MRYRIVMSIILIALVAVCYLMTTDRETSQPAAAPAAVNDADRF